jgi:AraC-like DNA-binding protein
METKIFSRLTAWQNWLFNEPSAGGLGPAFVREIVYRLLKHDKRHKPVEASRSHAKDDPVYDVIEFMKAHMDKPISVAVLAEEACMSESVFAHLFKQCVGRSPYQFLRQLRPEHAHDLLLEEHCTVSEAARRAGYSNPSHFIREFKRYFGETPRSYLQKLGAAGGQSPDALAGRPG